MSLAEEPAVGRVLEAVREQAIAFATADWLDLAPGLVNELQEFLRLLAPGAHPDWFFDGAQVQAAAPPSSTLSSVPSPAAPPPISHVASSESGVSHLVPPGSDAEHAARPTNCLSHASLPAAAASTSATTPVAPTRSRVEAATLRPGDRPDVWENCTRCRKNKEKCVPPQGASPGDSSCYSCLVASECCTRDSEIAGTRVSSFFQPANS